MSESRGPPSGRSARRDVSAPAWARKLSSSRESDRCSAHGARPYHDGIAQASAMIARSVARSGACPSASEGASAASRSETVAGKIAWDGSSTANGTRGATGSPPAGGSHASETLFRNWVTADGSPGPTGEGGFKAEPGRYHLYVSLACPWAHRTLIFRKLKKLTEAISVSVVEPHMLAEGWEFNETWPDHLYGKTTLYEIYQMADPTYTGRASVPVLWDKEKKTIVSNEFGRDHPHAELGLRRLRRSFARLLSGAASPRDRCAERRRLRERQQRRLQGRLRAEPGSLRGGVPRALQHARRARPAARRAALPDRRPADRSGLAAVHHAGSASTRSTTFTSSATGGGSPTTRTSQAICATFSRCRA